LAAVPKRNQRHRLVTFTIATVTGPGLTVRFGRGRQQFRGTVRPETALPGKE